MFLSKCSLCDNKRSRFIKEQEANGFLISLGTKRVLSQIPLVGPLLY